MPESLDFQKGTPDVGKPMLPMFYGSSSVTRSRTSRPHRHRAMRSSSVGGEKNNISNNNKSNQTRDQQILVRLVLQALRQLFTIMVLHKITGEIIKAPKEQASNSIHHGRNPARHDSASTSSGSDNRTDQTQASTQACFRKIT